ncbi:MAG TPA: twin-arginine translocation signal domain-containing protein [Pyrinomonadaceae bacterium]|jgi:protocatechuate 3,4-dioxygenase beta subunit
MNRRAETRRDFLRRTAAAAVAFPFLLNCRTDTLFAQKSAREVLERLKKNARPAGAEGMGAIDAPKDVAPRAVLTTAADRGEKMLITGTVFQPDGKRPAPNALIYLYHTDIEGYYGRKSGEHKHGRYRGWLLTDTNGKFEFTTIKPAPYPENRFAAHIHMTVTTENMKEDWIDSVLFEGDPLISARERETAGQKGGFNPIVRLEKTANGVWRATRDIRLWKA